MGAVHFDLIPGPCSLFYLYVFLLLFLQVSSHFLRVIECDLEHPVSNPVGGVRWDARRGLPTSTPCIFSGCLGRTSSPLEEFRTVATMATLSCFTGPSRPSFFPPTPHATTPSSSSWLQTPFPFLPDSPPGTTSPFVYPAPDLWPPQNPHHIRAFYLTATVNTSFYRAFRAISTGAWGTGQL